MRLVSTKNESNRFAATIPLSKSTMTFANRWKEILAPVRKSRPLTRWRREGLRDFSGYSMLCAMRFRLFFVALVPLGALWGLQNFVGERTAVTALLLYLPQHFWALWPLGFVLLGLFKSRRDALVAGALGLLFWSHFLLGFRFLGSLHNGIGASNSNSIRLMSYNIQRGANGPIAIERAIRSQHPDIVCLQESQGHYQSRVYAPGARVAARFPGWNRAQSGDVMTFSRFPIASQRDFPLRGTRRILETTLQTPRGPIRVLNIHVATSPKASKAPRKSGRFVRILTETQPKAQARLDQIAPIRAAIAAGSSRVPLLVAGDFNSPPRGLFYSSISRGLSDAWRAGGRGTGDSFPARFPLLPIDHVLARGVTVKRAWIADVRASDHRPIVVDWRF